MSAWLTPSIIPLQVAMGFVRVANETMCRPIRALTQMKGYDVAQHCLACFGGAGGQHACAIAQNLGMRTIFVHRYAGVLSAVGIGLADVVAEEQVRLSPLDSNVRRKGFLANILMWGNSMPASCCIHAGAIPTSVLFCRNPAHKL